MITPTRATCGLIALSLFATGLAELPAQETPNPTAPAGDTAKASPQITVGGLEITVPNPEDFERADGIFPEYDALIEGYISATNRLLANFLIPGEVAMLRSQEAPAADRSFNVQTLREMESRNFGPTETKRLIAESRREIAQQKDSIGKIADDLVKAGNEKISADYDTEMALKVSGTTILDPFEDSDTTLGFSIVADVTVDAETSRVITAVLMTTINGRLLYFYTTSPFLAKGDREWAESSVLRWADALRAANPVAEDSGRSGGFLQNISRPGLIGGIIGGVVAAIFIALRGKKQRTA